MNTVSTIYDSANSVYTLEIDGSDFADATGDIELMID